MPASGPILQLKEVSRHYALPGSVGPVRVLEGISLDVAHGESLAVVGPSGSGKSTVLHLMGGLDRPNSGQVLFEGEDLARLDDAQLAAFRNRSTGFVFQAHYLLPQCSVLENVLVPTLAVPSRHRDHQRAALDRSNNQEPGRPENANALAARLLARVGLSDRLNHRPAQLSGGECQRVAVVRALINGPHLLLADEPTGALDYASARQLSQLLLELNQEEKVTLVLVTHSLELARSMSRVFELKTGHLIEK